MEGVVIIGAGQAGTQCAFSLRERGYQLPITIIGNEDKQPYYRPPLSKAYMAGDDSDADLPLHGEAQYREYNIDLQLGTSATRIHREAKHVELSTGRHLPYERLIMATGARNRELPFKGGRPANAHYLRTWGDAETLKAALETSENVLIIGAGFIGLEFATVAMKAGKNVTVVEMAPRVMGRAVSEETSAHFTKLHRDQGIDVLCNTGVEGFEFGTGGWISGAAIDGTTRPVDLVLVGIGVLPNTEIAEKAGLTVDDGIVVDHTLTTTADPAIHAIGDCSRHPRPETPDLVRVESVQNASDQARFLAQHIVSGRDVYADVPWFWSHQAGSKLQIAGLAQPTDDSIVIGQPESSRFSIARVRDDRLVALESINKSTDHLACRKLLTQDAHISAEDLRRPDFSFHAAMGTPRKSTHLSSL